MRDLSCDTIQELLTIFRNSCLAQYETYKTEDNKKYNKLYDVIRSVAYELNRRGVEERRSLLVLLNDQNFQVRLQAAIYVYSVAQSEARACLETIRATKLPDLSLAAGMMLRGLEKNPQCLDQI